MNNHIVALQKIQEIQSFCQSILNGNQRNHLQEIEAILDGTNLKDIDILKVLSKELKVTPENIGKVYSNSEGFKILQEGCRIYKEIIEESPIQNQNFFNILFLNYLLTNIDSTNIILFAVYANLFIVDIDLLSFYQIILKHCIAQPKSVINLTLFLKEFNDLQEDDKHVKETLFNCFQINKFEWETVTVEKILDKLNKEESIEGVIKPTNPIIECILNDDIDEFRNIQVKYNLSYDSIIIFYSENNFWPFLSKTSNRMINIAAFCGSTKIFKFLLLNHASITNKLLDDAIAGGNTEIIHICQQYKCNVQINSFQMAIKYYHNDILAWLIENNQNLFEICKERIFNFSIDYSNPDALLMLLDNNCDFTMVDINLFKLFPKEWKKLLFYEDAVFNKVKKEIKILLNRYNYWSYSSILPLAEYYLKEKNELEQIKNNPILPPIPNNLVYDFIFKYEKQYHFIQYGMHSKEFILYLAKNKLIDTFDTKRSICKEAIEKDDVYYLTEMEKYDKNIPNIVASIVLPLTIGYVRKHRKSNICKYIFENVFTDTESNNEFFTTNLNYACFYNDIHMIEYLLSKKHIDVNSTKFNRNESPLILATECNNIQIVNLLLKDERVDVNLFCEDHKTAFYYACEYNYPEIVDMLLNDERVDINIPDKNGKTPFAIACEKGNNYIVKRILERNDADLNKLSNDGSPFGLSVKNWQHKTVKILIDCKKIRFQNENEENPLHQACLHGNLKMVELLFTIDSDLLNKNEKDDITLIKLT